jgi:hypothetical protein
VIDVLLTISGVSYYSNLQYVVYFLGVITRIRILKVAEPVGTVFLVNNKQILKLINFLFEQAH